MVWGGNTSIPCRGSGGGFGIFAKMAKMIKSLQNLCIGWRLGGVLAFLSFLAKTRCVSDLTKSSFVRHAASFGSFDKNGTKTRCVSG